MVFATFCGVAIAVLAWRSRFAMNPDGISYLDLADQIRAGQFGALLHPYWSPLFPGVLACFFSILAPAPEQEALTIHLINCAIALISVVSFAFFLRQNGNWSDRRAAIAFGLFLWGAIDLNGMTIVTPDLCVMAIVYAIAGLCYRLASPKGGTKTSIALGVTLTLGYLAKAAMLPLGVALLMILALSRRWFSISRQNLITAAAVFAITSGTYAAALSIHEDRLTFGDSGKINYAWLVTRSIPSTAGWVNGTSDAGVPLHPPRRLRTDPTVLEFAGTVPGTIPLWDDPVYFHEGLRSQFDLKKQYRALRHGLEELVNSHAGMALPLVGGLFLLAAGRLGTRSAGHIGHVLWLMIWAVSAALMYALCDSAHARYLSGFLVLFWVAAYEGLGASVISSSRPVHHAVATIVAVFLLLPQALSVAIAFDQRKQSEFPQRDVARELTRLGLKPGDGIATLSNPFDCYYARLAGVHVVATVGYRGLDDPFDTDRLAWLDQEQFATLQQQLRRVGAKALIGQLPCPIAGSTWRVIGKTGYCVHLLDPLS